nr:hypothetical protein [Chlamydiota bacterium]
FLLSWITAVTWQEDVKQIDQQIEQLQNLQDKYRWNMERNVNNAMRWQFQNQNYLDARRAWEQASQEKQKIQEIQDQIDDLEVRKKKILEEHGEEQPS